MPTGVCPVLDGAPNFRDIGGYRTTDGRRVRRGRLFRSESLHELRDNDLEALRGLGIQTICDLRSDHEINVNPTRWPQDCAPRTLHLNVSVDVRGGHHAMIETLKRNPSAESATEAMLVSYRDYPRAFAPHLKTLFDLLLEHPEQPLLFHCTAGKDRTGFLAFLLLHALGVPREDALEDYLLTSRYYPGPQARDSLRDILRGLLAGEPTEDVLIALESVTEHYLWSSLDVMTRDYSSVDAYLEKHAGLTPQRLATLRDALLE